jgi:16S rRNA pseudouridine516 synthase
MKLVKLLANLGYGSRKEVSRMLRNGWVTDRAGNTLGEDDQPAHEDVLLDDEPLDPAQGLLLMLHKPVGFTCSTKDKGRLIYELLPPRFRLRNPVLANVGRLDRDTSGLLLMTDDGLLQHQITSPRSHLNKVYRAELAEDLRGDEPAIFASGELMLEGEDTPLQPAEMRVLGPRSAELTLTEGRYHQVRRMFVAVGNHVQGLHRSRIGGLDLDGLASGAWRILDAGDRERLFGATGAGS